MSFLSVAVCTYNGEAFLAQQLSSILNQTRLPDEVVIRDDRSSDRTLSIVQAFKERAPFPVEVHGNEMTLGSTRNFECAIADCHGELIALSDQDDVWAPTRLEHSERELLHHPEAGLVFTDGNIVDDDGRLTGTSLWENFRLDQQALEALQSGDATPLARRTFVTGATVMFRAPYAKLCFPTGKYWWHDGWLAMLIAAMASVRPLEERLISYRSHTAQQIGLGSGSKAAPSRRWKTLKEHAAMQQATFAREHAQLAEACAAIERLPLTEDQRRFGALDTFRRRRDFLAVRLALPQERLARIPVMLELIEDYRASAMGVLSIAKDLVLPAHHNPAALAHY